MLYITVACLNSLDLMADLQIVGIVILLLTPIVAMYRKGRFGSNIKDHYS